MARLVILVSLLLSAAAAAVSRGSQPSDDALAPDEIKRAIAFGRASQPAPYSMPSIFRANTRAAALLYTPFVRIALAAREALKAGGRYEITDVDPQDASNLLHVVMSADTVAPIGILTENDPVHMEVIEKPVQRLLGSPESRKAAWVRHESDRTIATLPGSSHMGVVVGAFTREQLCADCYVVSYRMHRTPEGHKEIRTSWAVIKKADIESWR